MEADYGRGQKGRLEAPGCNSTNGGCAPFSARSSYSPSQCQRRAQRNSRRDRTSVATPQREQHGTSSKEARRDGSDPMDCRRNTMQARHCQSSLCDVSPAMQRSLIVAAANVMLKGAGVSLPNSIQPLHCPRDALIIAAAGDLMTFRDRVAQQGQAPCIHTASASLTAP